MVQPAPDDEHQSDVDLRRGLQAGDPAAFERLVREQGGRMRAVARRLLRNDADADEVVQEAFLACLGQLDEFRGEASIASWLHRIVINGALMRLRARRTAAEELPEGLAPEFVECGAWATLQEPWPDGPLAETLRAEARDEVRASIARLPETLRTALVLRDLEGLSNEETAERLGVSPNAAKLRVHRGRQAVRELLDRSFGGTEPAAR